MIKSNSLNNGSKNGKTNNSRPNNIKIFSEMTKKDIEKSYNIDSVSGTEAHYSVRYGWTLRRSTD